MRRIWPSVVGDNPRLESRIAFSTAPTMLRSHTCTESMRASGTLMEATVLMGWRWP